MGEQRLPTPTNPAWLDDYGLEQAPFRVYFHIRRRGICTSELKTIAAKCRMNKDTAQKAINHLIKIGLVKHLGKHRTSHYVALAPTTTAELAEFNAIRKEGMVNYPKPGDNCYPKIGDGSYPKIGDTKEYNKGIPIKEIPTEVGIEDDVPDFPEPAPKPPKPLPPPPKKHEPDPAEKERISKMLSDLRAELGFPPTPTMARFHITSPRVAP